MTATTSGPPPVGVNMAYPEAPLHGRRAFRIPETYIAALREAGLSPLLVPSIPDDAFLRNYVGQCRGFLFIGGTDYPAHLYGQTPDPNTKEMSAERWQTDLKLAEQVLATDMPIVAICGGIQLMAVATGGRLIQHLPTTDDHWHPKKGCDREHRVHLSRGSSLARICGAENVRVNSHHHQAVDPENPGSGWRITAVADDGVVEGIEDEGGRFRLGVQWHPERIADSNHRRRIFAAFADAVKRRPEPG